MLFDGAMGTEIQRLNPKPEDFPDGKDGFNDGLNISRPEWVMQIHRSYLKAGADCIETNTFGSNKFKLDEYGYGDKTVEFNKKAAQLAREVCNELRDRPSFVIGSMGPTGYLPSSNDPDLGQKPLDEIRDIQRISVQQIDGFGWRFLRGRQALVISDGRDDAAVFKHITPWRVQLLDIASILLRSFCPRSSQHRFGLTL